VSENIGLNFLVNKMLRTTTFVSAATLLSLSFLSSTFYAEDKTPHEIIEQTSTQVLTALNSDASDIKNNPNKINDLVDEIILPICDLERMGKYILAKHWKTATEDQRSAFVTEFKAMLIRNYGKHLIDYAGAKVTVIPDKISEEKLYQTVNTKLDTRIGSKPFQVDYVFRVTENTSKGVDGSYIG